MLFFFIPPYLTYRPSPLSSISSQYVVLFALILTLLLDPCSISLRALKERKKKVLETNRRPKLGTESIAIQGIYYSYFITFFSWLSWPPFSPKSPSRDIANAHNSQRVARWVWTAVKKSRQRWWPQETKKVASLGGLSQIQQPGFETNHSNITPRSFLSERKK